MLRKISVCITIMLVAISYGQVLSKASAVPKMLNYQGYLTDTLGSPIIDPGCPMLFAIYNMAEGGDLLWSEEKTVNVERGIFSAILGSGVPIPDSVFRTGTDRWLQLTVNGQIQSPRTRITAMAYAYTATYSDTADYAKSAVADTDWIIMGDNMHSGISGNVGIGTTSPADSTKLHVESNNLYAGFFTSDSQDLNTHVVHSEFTESGNHDAKAVYGKSTPADFYGIGGYFVGGYKGVFSTVSPTGNMLYYGVHGMVHGGSGDNYGIYGTTSGSGTNYGVFGNAFGSGTNYGVFGKALDGSTNYAGYFEGDVHITGTLTGGFGSFLTDHPLDPENMTLRHNFVESPENLCLYRGKIKLDNNGEATVKMPDYFEALTKEEEATISLTSIGRPFNTGYEWKSDYTEFMVYGEPSREVSYIVLADRDDPVMHQLHRPVEQEKGNGNFEKGKLLYPGAYGYPEEMGVDYAHQKKAEKIRK